MNHLLSAAEQLALALQTHRREKAIFDLCSELMRFSEEATQRVERISAYRVLEGYTTSWVRAHFPSAVRLQFLVVKSAGLDTSESPQPVVQSKFIQITDPDAKQAEDR